MQCLFFLNDKIIEAFLKQAYVTEDTSDYYW